MTRTKRSSLAPALARLSAVTARGGIKLAPRPGMRLFASESATRTSWSHRVALCLPETRCKMSRRNTLTELGPDTEALREADREAILFDLGLDACKWTPASAWPTRASPPNLRACAGRPVFEHGNPAMEIILAASPPRVFLSRLGRIEVFAPIPPPNGKSPEGPHTHVLPKLLAHKRTHAATEPVPEGYVPCAHLYPAHPLKDSLGRELAYDAPRHESFQDILRRFGDPNAVALKQHVMAAVAQGGDPSTACASPTIAMRAPASALRCARCWRRTKRRPRSPPGSRDMTARNRRNWTTTRKPTSTCTTTHTEDPMRLKDKIAIVVGAGQSPGEGMGNGRATALRFAQEGAKVLAVDNRPRVRGGNRRHGRASEGGDCVAFEADVTKEQTLAAMVADAQRRWGRIDILHYNVGVSIAGGDAPPTEITEEAFDRVVRDQPARLRDGGEARAADHARADAGVIITISSIAAWSTIPTSPTRRPRRR